MGLQGGGGEVQGGRLLTPGGTRYRGTGDPGSYLDNPVKLVELPRREVRCRSLQSCSPCGGEYVYIRWKCNEER